MISDEDLQKIDMNKQNSARTICEVLREIYHSTDDPIIQERLVLATAMAKKMDAKLREYKADYDKGWWEK
jgi:hypothetical protein